MFTILVKLDTGTPAVQRCFAIESDQAPIGAQSTSTMWSRARRIDRLRCFSCMSIKLVVHRRYPPTRNDDQSRSDAADRFIRPGGVPHVEGARHHPAAQPDRDRRQRRLSPRGGQPGADPVRRQPRMPSPRGRRRRTARAARREAHTVTPAGELSSPRRAGFSTLTTRRSAACRSFRPRS